MSRLSFVGRPGALVLVLALGCAKSAPATAPESTPPPPSVAAPESTPEPAPASEEACNDGESCEQLASTVAEEDPARALELWEKACEFGALGACFNAAEQVREDDSAKAVGLYGKAQGRGRGSVREPRQAGCSDRA